MSNREKFEAVFGHKPVISFYCEGCNNGGLGGYELCGERFWNSEYVPPEKQKSDLKDKEVLYATV